MKKAKKTYGVQIDLIKTHSFLVDSAKGNVESKRSRFENPIVKELTTRGLRWMRVPNNYTLHNPPPYGKHYRLVFALTAEYPESTVRENASCEA